MWTYVGKVMSLLFNVLSRWVVELVVKNRLPVLETQAAGVWYLDQEDLLEKGMVTHFSILPGESHG